VLPRGPRPPAGLDGRGGARKRTRETAEILAERLELPVELRPGLLEIDFGQWTGWRFEELRGREDWRRFNAERSTAVVPGGESMHGLRERVRAEVAQLVERHPDAAVVVVSHGDVIKAALLHHARRSFDEMPGLAVPTASLSVLAVAAPDRGDVLGVGLR
jgi:probable phosphoglycerate mutase